MPESEVKVQVCMSFLMVTHVYDSEPSPALFLVFMLKSARTIFGVFLEYLVTISDQVRRTPEYFRNMF